ncbi:MAG: DMT family transporter [Mycobacteriaceae bacterium]|uniref:DMT family transporter n=1 Tax=Corynebacterium sp. TaxID=1720 RepID=UPI003F9A736D
MTYILLATTITCGVAGTLFTRASRGLTRWGYAVGAVFSYGAATVLLARLVENLPLGIVYAVWTGSAAVILLAIDTAAFKVRTTHLQRAGMLVTVAGVALLGGALS